VKYDYQACSSIMPPWVFLITVTFSGRQTDVNSGDNSFLMQSLSEVTEKNRYCWSSSIFMNTGNWQKFERIVYTPGWGQLKQEKYNTGNYNFSYFIFNCYFNYECTSMFNSNSESWISDMSLLAKLTFHHSGWILPDSLPVLNFNINLGRYLTAEW